MLLESGIDINARDCFNRTPTHFAAAGKSDSKIVKCLIDNGADINPLD